MKDESKKKPRGGLCLRTRVGQRILIGDQTVVKISSTKGNLVLVRIEAPREVRIKLLPDKEGPSADR